MAYLAGDDFQEDCRLIGIDPASVGKMVVEMLKEDEDEREKNVTRLKRKVRKQ